VPASNIPRGQIEFLVGRMHVNEPLGVVAKEIRRRCLTSPGSSKPLCDAAARYAKKVHLDNRIMYLAVSRGMLGSMYRKSLRAMAKAMG
jgi:hypothetical protein